MAAGGVCFLVTSVYNSSASGIVCVLLWYTPLSVTYAVPLALNMNKIQCRDSLFVVFVYFESYVIGNACNVLPCVIWVPPTQCVPVHLPCSSL